MNSRFLLPCQCGQSVSIELSQAGQSLTCSCGRTVTAPSMRGIRELEPDLREPTETERQTSWSATRGALFALGALALLSGLLIFLYSYYDYVTYTQIAEYEPTNDAIAHDFDRIDRLGPAELIDVFHNIAHAGLGEREDSPFLIARGKSRYLRAWLIAAATLCIGGVALSLGTLIPARRSPARS